MKTIRSILILMAIALCGHAAAETPQVAYGVTIVGQQPCVSAGLRCTNLSTHPYVLVGGFSAAGDNGGGYFAMGPAGCADNGGTILKDLVGDCFYRTDARAAIPVQWFGAKCDAITTVYGGTISQYGTEFTSSSSVTFQQSDVGKVIELNAMGTGVVPFSTTISAVDSSTTVTLGTLAPYPYPGAAGVTSANFRPILENGLDAPGAGYQPQDQLAINAPATTPAVVQVADTSLVNFNWGGGSGYAVNELIYFTATDNTDFKTVRPATIQVTQINQMTGAVMVFAWIDNGRYRAKNGGTANPSAFKIKPSGAGSGFSITLLASNGSFGVGTINPVPVNPGAYTTLPPIPAQTTCITTGCTGTGATVDLTMAMPTWIYGTDDTVPLTALEIWMETDYNRGIYNAAEVPGAHSCLLQTLQINRPVTWRSSGSRQAQLLQVMGAKGSQVNTSSPSSFVLVAANLPPIDVFQDTTVGEQAVGFNNISIAGGGTAQTVNVNGTSISYTNNGLLFEDPTGKVSTNVNVALQNLQVVNFPGNSLSAYYFSGEFRGYNVYAGSSGGNCVDIEHTANPYRFYGLVASACTMGIGLNLVQTKSEEFHGVSVYGTSMDLSVTGTLGDPEAYILFDGAQFDSTHNENIYLDQQNETVLCAANCYINDGGKQCQSGGDCDAAIVIGPDATTSAGGATPTILQLQQGAFGASDVDTDIQFDAPNGTYCVCQVSLGGAMLDAETATGVPTTNVAAQMLGQTHYGPPTFSNAASVGVPLTLNPNELGIGVSTDTEGPPGQGGLKLRVECSTQSGKVKLVVLAGTLNTETVLADGIGGGVGGSCGS